MSVPRTLDWGRRYGSDAAPATSEARSGVAGGIGFVDEARHELSRDAVAPPDVGQRLPFRVQDLEQQALGAVTGAFQLRQRVDHAGAQRLRFHDLFQLSEWSAARDQFPCGFA